MEKNSLRKQSYSKDNDSLWLGNFPKKFRRRLVSYEPDVKDSGRTSVPTRKAKHTIASLNYQYGSRARNISPNISYKKFPIKGVCPQDLRLRDTNLGANLWGICQTTPNINHYIGISKGISVSSSHNFQSPPIHINDLAYNVIIGDDLMYIGCQCYSIKEWKQIEDKKILLMDGRKSLNFWNKYKDILLHIADLYQIKYGTLP